ncbi:hypothetical protein CO675_18700 [Bradyrhizobium sp. C9]|nr:hypothetical protein CO675_18700 [Bradyrhizobium sp. C9]
MSQTPSSSSHHKKCWCSEWAQRAPGIGGADGAKPQGRGIRPDVRHKGLLLGGAAKAVVRGWLENDGD